MWIYLICCYRLGILAWRAHGERQRSGPAGSFHPDRKWCRLDITAHPRNHRGEAIEILHKYIVENLTLKTDCYPAGCEEGSPLRELPLDSCTGKTSACGSDLSKPCTA